MTNVRLGQTSFIYFLSRIITSALGFLSTLYFARELGANVLGTYFLIIAVIAWIKLVGEVGVGGALTKRLSEGREQVPYLIAGIAVMALLTAIVLIGIYAFGPQVRAYTEQQRSPDYIAALLIAAISYSYTGAALKGGKLVHVWAAITAVRSVSRVLVQIGAVAIGLGLAGLAAGWVAGTVIAASIGAIVLLQSLNNEIKRSNLPRRSHLIGLFSYAKYSWLGSVSTQSFRWVDIIVLGALVQPSLVGIYSIAWNIATVLRMFGTSIRTSMFPEMSELAAKDGSEQVGRLLEDSLSFSGVILFPGLVGGVLLRERILRLYGAEFVAGSTVLILLILSSLVYDYQLQFTNTLNAIDRPDLSFRSNAAFILINILLNIILIYLFGWLGAAVATLLSGVFVLGMSFHYLYRLVPFDPPLTEISRQIISSILMGIFIYIVLRAELSLNIINHNATTVVILVIFGAGIYFFIYTILSSRFRSVVRENFPDTISVL